MENLSLILYIGGLAGLSLCIILIGTSFHKKNKFFSLITLLFIFLSVISLGAGTITQLIEKKNTVSTDVVQNKHVNTKDTDSTKAKDTDLTTEQPSKDDLLFEYTLKNKQFYININNKSTEIFNGTVHIKQTNNNTSLSEFDLPISNLLSEESVNYNMLALNSANLLDYEFIGNFSKDLNSTTPYSIASMGVGNGYIRFEIVAQNNSIDSLLSICKTFKNTYTSKYCKGFLIYFIDSENDNLDKSYADYYCNNEGSTSILTNYTSNTTMAVN